MFFFFSAQQRKYLGYEFFDHQKLTKCGFANFELRGCENCSHLRLIQGSFARGTLFAREAETSKVVTCATRVAINHPRHSWSVFLLFSLSLVSLLL